MKQKLVNIIEDLIQSKSKCYEYWRNEENANRLQFYIKQKPRISRVIDILSGSTYFLITVISSLVMLHMLEGTYVLQDLEAKIVIRNLFLICTVMAALFVGCRFLMNKYFSVEVFFSSIFYLFMFLVGYMDAEANCIFIPLILVCLLHELMRCLWKIIDYRERIADGRISKVYFNPEMQNQTYDK